MAKGTLFSLDNLRLLDFGKIGTAFQSEVEHVVKDCMERPGDEHARFVQLRFNIAPTTEDGITNCDTVKVECEITSGAPKRRPKRRTKIYEMRPNVKGQFSFNPDIPDDPDSETLYDKEERKEDHGK